MSRALHGRLFALVLLLLAFYGASASGAFHSIDEHAVFAVGRALFTEGRTDQDALPWGEPYLQQARVGVDGLLYAKYGIGHSLLLVPWLAMAALLPGAGFGPTAMLLNGLATALTALALALAVRQLGYGERTALSIALLFGVATPAGVYAKTMFGEPLVALFWVAALGLLLGTRSPGRAFAAGALLALSVAVRPSSVLFIPPFLLLLEPRRRGWRRWAAFGAPLILTLLGLAAFNVLRFGDPLEFGYSESFSGTLAAGLTAFLFSLDRSLFLFAPPLLALPWATGPFLRRHGVVGWTVLIVAGLSLVAYSMWPVFWGGPVWGPRYLLPVVPLLLLILAPWVEHALTRRGAALGWLLALGLAGSALNLLGTIWNPLPLTQSLGQRAPLWLFAPRAAWIDVAWMRGGSPMLLALAVAAALLAAAALVRPRRPLLAAAGGTTLVLLLLMPSALGMAGFGYPEEGAYGEVMAHLDAEGRVGDALVLNAAPYQRPTDQLLWFLSQPRLGVPVYGLYREAAGAASVTGARLTTLLARHSRIWLLTEGVAPGDDQSTAEAWLAVFGVPVKSVWLSDGFRLTLVEARRPLLFAGRPATDIGGVARLERWEVAPAATPGSWQVTLRWQVQSRPEGTSLQTFVQLIDAAGKVAALWDSVPQSGFAPAEGWVAGRQVEERMVLGPVDGEAPVTLVAGLYDPVSGRRLLTGDGSDHLVLTILPAPVPAPLGLGVGTGVTSHP